MFQRTSEEVWALFGINIFLGINKILKMRNYWSLEEGFGNILIQKAMANDRFLDILQNILLF